MESQHPVAPAEAREAVARIVASPGFAGSERRKRLLEYLVDRTLTDGGATLKEFNIGVDVYARDPKTYEPREDATVRVDIARLRSKLQDYYEKDGHDDPVRLELPRGSYSIVFHSGSLRTPAGVTEPPPRKRFRKSLWIGGAALAACLAAFGAYRLNQNRAPFHSVVVLPFLDLSPTHTDEYLSDGLTDELTGQLAQIPGLRVVARTSAYAFKGKPEDVRRIGAALHADAVLEGSVQRSGDRLRINVQLNRSANGYHLWSETYDRSAADLFRVEDEVSRAVARALRIRISGRTPRRDAADEQAHTLYLQARYFWNKRTVAGIRQALDLLDEAARRDPSWALVYAAKADCYASLIGNEQMAPAEAGPKLIDAAHRAIALDDSLGEAHAALGVADFFFGHAPGAAEVEFQRAIELSPNYATAYQDYGSMLMMLRRFDEARRQWARAQELDPLALVIPAGVGLMDYFERRPAACRGEADAILKMDPDFWMAHYLRGVCANLEHRDTEAISELQMAEKLSGHDQPTLAALAMVYVSAGNRAEAMRILAELEQPPPAQYASPVLAASVYAALGDRQHMFAKLAEAEGQHASGLMELAVRPQYDAFRSDPQFRALLARLNLPLN